VDLHVLPCLDEEVEQWVSEIQEVYPGKQIIMQPLSLSVSCHRMGSELLGVL
jgi:hypothetical protein